MIYKHPQTPEQGGALIIVLMLMLVMSISLLVIHDYTDGTGRETARTTQALQANAAAGAAADVVIGRLIQWINANNSYTPSIADCATVGVPGNPSFPAIDGPVTFPAGSLMGDYTVSTPIVYPVLPDDTVATITTASNYLPNVSQRINISDNSPNSPARYYFTHTASENAQSVLCKSITYQVTVTVTPKITTDASAKPVTLVRYLRMDKMNPFGWCTYRNGSAIYASSDTYTGPLYVAGNVSFYSPTTFTDSVLYGLSSANYGATFTNGGYASQVKQTSLLSLIPNLVNNMAVNSAGARLAGYETNTTAGGASNSTTADPADMFSTREVIETPTNPSNDTTPAVFKNARIYNQADVRIQVSVSLSGGVKVVTKNVVNIDGSTVSAASNAWVTPLLAAVNVNTASAGTGGAFIDRQRSTTQSIQSTDINVGALGSVMNANPTIFPTGIIYVWDSSGAIGGVVPLTAVRVWDAGVLPNVGLDLGTDDPMYMKGDFNTGATLPSNPTINSLPSVLPYSSNGMAVDNSATTESQRTVPGYTIKPAGLFGDSMTELSNGWTDTNSMNTQTAHSTTFNLVENWTTMAANELRADDTYLDPQSRANPLWIENWGSARRTMSGEEFCVWHSKYGANTSESYNGWWQGDISYDSKATALKLNWGATIFVRDRVARQ